jgi:hypothetical protein
MKKPRKPKKQDPIKAALLAFVKNPETKQMSKDQMTGTLERLLVEAGATIITCPPQPAEPEIYETCPCCGRDRGKHNYAECPHCGKN